MSQVRIVSNSLLGFNTKITDAETGVEIPRVTDVDISISATKFSTATLHTIMPIVDVIVDADIQEVCPVCHRVTNKEIVNAEHVAQMFHEAYEALAPEYGYQTRKESAVAWSDVPESNKKLMIATVTEVLYKLNIQ